MTSFGLDKSKVSEFKKTKKEILSEIKPSTKQLAQEKKIVDNIIKKINNTSGKHKKAILAGSFARGTNLKDSKDFDIFVLYPPETLQSEFVEEGLSLGKQVFKGYFWEKAYSQHPYIRGIIDGYKIEVVPAYDVPDLKDMISAVDRTPHHQKYMQRNLKSSQKDDVRLLKYFLRKINCYGSDSQYEGFAGYLCELLILYYKDFLGVLQAASNWSLPVKLAVVGEQHQYLDNFNDSLVVIDPVDDNRNVGSAVSETTISKFILASRKFLENPTIDFFKRRVVRQLTYHQLVGVIDSVPLAVIQVNVKDMLKDIVWSKVKSLNKKLVSFIENNDFSVLRSEIYYTENNDYVYIFLMLNNLEMPPLKKQVGPFVSDIASADNFINNSRGLFGPYVKEGRLYIIKHTQKTNIKQILHDFPFNNFSQEVTIFVDKEIRDLYLKHTDITNYFSWFLLNKEEFLM
jgi:tRNA nucleotidyltransferase (CCA-adding enzyme)